MKAKRMICMAVIMPCIILLVFAYRPASGAWTDEGLYMKTTDQGVVVDSTLKAYLNLDRGTKSEDAWLGFKSAGAYNWLIATGRTGANSDLSFCSYAYNTWDTPLYLEYATGNIGIGTTSPASKLHVVGRFRTTDSSGNMYTYICNTGADSGYVGTYGPNGDANTALSHQPSNGNHGAIIVCDEGGSEEAGMYVDASGNGIVWGDTKNFRMDNPAQPGTEIWYACIEGPEAAAYLRGTGHLENGQDIINFPGHFTDVVGDNGITVQVTPLSSESRGLAVVEKSSNGITVQELSGGTGTYNFDYLVIAVREGHEDYQIIRSSGKGRSAAFIE